MNNTAGRLIADGKLSMTAQAVQSERGTISAQGDLLMTVEEGIVLDQGQLFSDKNLHLQSTTLSADKAKLGAQGQLQVTATQGARTQGSEWRVGDALTLNAKQIDLTGARVAAESLALRAQDALTSQGSLLVAEQDATLAAHTLTTSQATVSAGKTLSLRAVDRLTNEAGTLVANEALTLHTKTMLNAQGQVSGGKHLTLSASETLDNQAGKLLSGGEAQLRVGQLENHQGKLHTQSQLTIEATRGMDSQQSEIVAGGPVQISAQSDMRLGGLVVSGDALSIQAGDLSLDTAHTQAQQLHVKSAGDLSLSDSTLLAQTDAHLHAGNHLRVNKTQLQARDAIELSAGQDADFTQSSVMSEVGRLLLTAHQSHQTQTSLAAHALDMQLRGDLHASQGQWQAKQDLHLDAQSMTLSQMKTVAQSVAMQTLGDVNHQASVLVAEGDVHLSAHKVTNRDGQMIAGGRATVLATGQVDNQKGRIAADNSLQIQADALTNQEGQLSSAQAVDIAVKQRLDNTQGTILAAKQVNIGAQSVRNQAGQVSAGEDLTIVATGTVDNQAGLLVSDNTIRLHQNHLRNTQGQLHAGGGIQIQASQGIESQASEIIANQAIQMVTQGTITQGGLLSAQETLNINAKQLRHQDAQVQSSTIVATTQEDMSVSDSTLVAQAGITLNVGTDMGLSAAQIQAREAIDLHAQQQLTVSDTIVNSTHNTIRLTAHDSQQQGSTLVADAITAQLGGALNAKESQWFADKALTVTAKAIAQEKVTLVAENLAIRADKTLTSQHSQWLADKALSVKAYTIEHIDGKSRGATVALTALGHIDHQRSVMVADEAITIRAQGVNNQAGTLSAGTTLGVEAAEVLNNQAGLIVADSTVNVQTTTFNNHSGDIASGEHLTLKVADHLDNQAGRIASAQQAGLTVGSLNNSQQGSISAGNEASIAAAQSVINQSGTIVANQALRIAAQDVDNRAGQLSGGQGIDIKAQGELNNHSGLLVSDKHLTLTLGQLDNSHGKLHAKTDAVIDATKDIRNLDGEILAGQHVQVHALGEVVNSGLMSAQQKLTLDAQMIAQQGGRLQGNVVQLKAQENMTMRDNSRVVAQTTADLSAGQDILLDHTQVHAKGDIDVQAKRHALMNASEIHSQAGQLRLSVRALDQHESSLGARDIRLEATGAVNAKEGQWLADKTLTLLGDTFTLFKMKTAADIVDITATTALNHQQSTLMAKESLGVHTENLTNTQSQLAAGEHLTLNARQQLSNQGGTILAERNLRVNTARVDNQGGKLSAKQDLSIRAQQGVHNQGGTLVADEKLTLNTPVLENRGGILSAGDDAQLTISQAFSNQHGTLVSDNNIQLNTAHLDNTQGKVHAKGDVRLELAQSLTNNSGELLAGKTLTIADPAKTPAQRRLRIEQDAHGILQGNAGTTIVAQTLDSQARVETPGHLHLDVVKGLRNVGGLQAGGDLSVVTQEAFHNAHTMYSPHALTIQASTVHNAATGELAGETAVTVTASAGDVINRGLINSNGTTTVKATGTVENVGTGRIYGDHVKIQAKTLLNREEAQADGSRKAAVIAGREQVDIGVETLNNREEALIFSGGKLAIGRHMDAYGDAQGQATRLINSGATIESMGDMRIVAGTVHNLNPHVEVTSVQVGPVEKLGYVVHEARSYETRVDKKELKLVSWSRPDMWVSKEPGDYAKLIPGETPLWSIDAAGCHYLYHRLCRPLSDNTELANFEKYAPDNPAWAYFGITPGITHEPHKPVAPQAPEVDDPRGCSQHFNTLDREMCQADVDAWINYRQAYANYQTNLAAYQDAHQAWMVEDGPRWFQLNQALTAYNKKFQHRFEHEYTEYWINRTTHEDQVVSSRPGDIIAGGNLTIDADSLVSDKSRIVAGQALQVNAGRIQHIDLKGTRVVTDQGRSRYSWEEHHGGFGGDSFSREYDTPVPFQSVRQETIDLPVSVYQAYTTLSPSGTTPAQLTGQGQVSMVKQQSTAAAANGTAINPSAITVGQMTSTTQQSSQAATGVTAAMSGDAQQGPTLPNIGGQGSDVSLKHAIAYTSSTGSNEGQAPGVMEGAMISPVRALSSASAERASHADQTTLSHHQASTLKAPQTAAPEGAAITALSAQRILVPNNSLYSVDPARTRYLVATDPAFTNQRQWLSSDYMLQALNQDPARMMKRLGDGYYEQRLLREQILQLTGHRFLDGYENDEAQFKALMQQGVTFAKEQRLTPGISLTAAQVARLTSDIVWLERQEVTLPNGTTQTVLVPRVYVKPRQGDLANTGALLAGKTVELSIKNGFVNSGTVAGRDIVSIQADTMENTLATIQGKRVHLEADKEIRLLGSTVVGQEVASIRAGNHITLESATYHTRADIVGEKGTHFSGERKGIDRLASIHVTGDQAQLLLSAGKDMTLTAALISNTGKDGHTQLGAGRDLNVGTVTTGYRQDSIVNARNYIKEQRWQDVGTHIQAVGDIQLIAGRNANLTAAQVSSEHGHLQVAAKENLTVQAGQLESHLDERHVTKSRSLFGSKSKDKHWLQDTQEAIASELTGAQVTLQSGHDIRIRGSDIISDQSTQLYAARDITLEGAQEHAFSDYHEKIKKSGFFGTGGLGFTIGSKSTQIDHDRTDGALRGSLVGSLEGNTVIHSGRGYSQEASTVSTPQGHLLITGQRVDITAGAQPYSENYRRVDKQSGLTGSGRCARGERRDQPGQSRRIH
ncbi:MAG: hemagglutinin repeat-containing protein [Pelistega sp.]|nr:hemagglutinin repeat-containing protein [Pelistega sp.]